MSEPQLSTRRGKARDLAHALSRRIGQPINRLVELALERCDQALREDKIRYPMDVVWDPARRSSAQYPARHHISARRILRRKRFADMIAVDTSVIIAIAADEPEAEVFRPLIGKERLAHSVGRANGPG
jgi:antitoxin VapB